MVVEKRAWLRLGAMSGFLAVAAGAFGAHAARDAMARDLISVGSHYQAIHAVAVMLWCALPLSGRWASWTPVLFLVGSLLFSGSLYGLALGAPRLLGLATPIGGVMFLMGWAGLALGARLTVEIADGHSGN
jgi:uncharacterized membrane protein YgdD (TMEM256/DUF423 family)